MSRYIDIEPIEKKLGELTIGQIKKKNSAFDVYIAIKKAPTADVEEVRHGKWIPQPSMDDRYSRYYICSVCGRLEQVSHAYDIKAFSPYCHCGAKMDKEKTE